MRNLRRLLAPRHIAVFGGRAAAETIRQCRGVGFAGPIWPVNPNRSSIEGLDCFPDTASLPAAPDAAFVAVPGESTVDVVKQLAGLGAGGVVCHASGFAERGHHVLQRSLVDAAGDMALIGPNCIGTLNYLDGAALWPDQHGGQRVERGVAVITQSGNIGQNLTMQRRSLPLAQLVTLGNGAVTGVPELVEAMLADHRITAIGLHLEGIDDVAGLSAAALAAQRAGVPIVVLKSGSSELGARANLSHTSSLAGSDVLCDALFRRYGMARVHQLGTFVEALKFLHVHGSLAGERIASASCSGGEAALVADLAGERGPLLPEFPAATAQRLREVLGDRVEVANPLDYHTYIWGDLDAQTACFTEFLGAGVDAHLLVLDLPRPERCSDEPWQTTLDAFVAAHQQVGGPACVVSTLPEGLPESVGGRLLTEGIAPMQGLADCIDAVVAAARIGAASLTEPLEAPRPVVGRVRQLDEQAGKAVLKQYGLTVPDGAVVTSSDAPEVAAELGFPVAVKAIGIAHKTDAGAVRIGLENEREVRDAVDQMSGLADRFLVERMVEGAVAELLIGFRRDPQFGPALTLGAGGVLVELVEDAVTLLLPTSRQEIRKALQELRIWPLLAGFRGRSVDVDAVVDAVMAVVDCARDRDVVELDVNPLLALPGGAVAVDVLMQEETHD